MKYLNFKVQLLAVAIGTFAFSACKKVTVPESMGDAGQILVKTIGGGTPAGIVKSPVNFVATPTTIVGADIRRDVSNTAQMNTTMHVIVKDDTAAVTAANSAYVKMPISWYKIMIDGVATSPASQGLSYTVTLNPGELAKQIYIVIPDATLFNPSALYGLGFTISTVDAGGKISTQKSVVVEIGAKNAYDGIYSVVSGNVQRYTAGVPEPITVGGLNGDLTGNDDVILTTIGANTVSIPPSSPAGPGRLLWAFGSNSAVAGVDGISITVDPATNLTNAVCAGNATLTNWAGHINNWTPSSKTFHLSFRWNPTGNTREYEIVLKYKGPR